MKVSCQRVGVFILMEIIPLHGNNFTFFFFCIFWHKGTTYGTSYPTLPDFRNLKFQNNCIFVCLSSCYINVMILRIIFKANKSGVFIWLTQTYKDFSFSFDVMTFKQTNEHFSYVHNICTYSKLNLKIIVTWRQLLAANSYERDKT